jgi:SAM-dependent methyltransferase
VPTPEPLVDAMLDLAEVKRGDVVYDLGSGDGRIVVAALRRGADRAVGVDIDPERVREGRANAASAGVGGRAQFRQDDLFKAEIGEATVVTLYLLPDVNESLRPRLLSQLRPGTRIVSHDFDMGPWRPDRSEDVRIGRTEHTIYKWVVPARVEGQWTGTIPTSAGDVPCAFDLKQAFQAVEGTVTIGETRHAIRDGKLAGATLSFTAPEAAHGGALRIEARVNGRRIEGQVTNDGGGSRPIVVQRQIRAGRGD